jgi:hypothetical protein
MSIDISEEYIASIFTVEEEAKQETSVKAGGKQSQASTLKMEAICSSETSDDFQQTTQHYIPEASTLQCTLMCQGNVQRA